MKRSVFFQMAVGFKILARTPVPKLHPSPSPPPHSRGFGSKLFAKFISSRGFVHGDVYLKRDVVRFDEELTLILHIKGRQIESTFLQN